jgi:hypothetical protein
MSHDTGRRPSFFWYPDHGPDRFSRKGPHFIVVRDDKSLAGRGAREWFGRYVDPGAKVHASVAAVRLVSIRTTLPLR